MRNEKAEMREEKKARYKCADKENRGGRIENDGGKQSERQRRRESREGKKIKTKSGVRKGKK